LLVSTVKSWIERECGCAAIDFIFTIKPYQHSQFSILLFSAGINLWEGQSGTDRKWHRSMFLLIRLTLLVPLLYFASWCQKVNWHFNTWASGCFRGFLEKKHVNACGFAREYLRSCTGHGRG